MNNKQKSAVSRETVKEILKEFGIKNPSNYAISLLEDALLDAYWEGRREATTPKLRVV